MNFIKSLTAASAPALLVLLGVGVGAEIPSTSRPSVFGVFVGTSPSDEPIRQMLQISSDPVPEIIRWRLTLYQDPQTLAPTRYELRCDYGLTAPNEPGLAKEIRTLERRGVWTRSKGSKSNSNATVFDLKGALSLVQIDDNILHVLNRERSLMIGNGGWSYTLNRIERAEKPVDVALARSAPDMSRQVLPLATGRSVFAVFEGRSPCKGIAGELRIPTHAGCMKAKWRVTLYQNPETLAPTTFRVEGTLYRNGGMEGNWARIQGRSNVRYTIVYRLTPNSNDQALYLLKADDNVLFFLNQNQQPLVGTTDFSYTLNRRPPSGWS